MTPASLYCTDARRRGDVGGVDSRWRRPCFTSRGRRGGDLNATPRPDSREWSFLRRCCALDDSTREGRASRLGIPHHVVNLERSFHDGVIAPLYATTSTDARRSPARAATPK